MIKLHKSIIAKIIGVISGVIVLAYFPNALGSKAFASYMLFIAEISLVSQLIVLGLPILLMRDNLSESGVLFIPNNMQFFIVWTSYIFYATAKIVFLGEYSFSVLASTAALIIMRMNVGILRGKEYIFVPQIFDGSVRNLILSILLFYSLNSAYLLEVTTVIIIFVSAVSSGLVAYEYICLHKTALRSHATFSINFKVFCGNDIQKVIENFFILILGSNFSLNAVAEYVWIRKYFNYSYELGSMLTYTYVAEIRRNILERVNYCRYKLLYLGLSLGSLGIFTVALVIGAYINLLPIMVSNSFIIIATVIIITSLINFSIGPVTAWGSLVGQEKWLFWIALFKIILFSSFVALCSIFEVGLPYYLCGYYISTALPNLIYASVVKKTSNLKLLVASDLLTFVDRKKL